LFDAPPPASYVYAKEFVAWCCGFGSAFRNSPDVTNLRYWAQKKKIEIAQREERAILDAARPLFEKRVGQAVRMAIRESSLTQ
jgi:hypothetical protein